MLHGFGVKLRSEYYADLALENNGVDWLEILSENYINASQYDLFHLRQMAERYAITMHGVSMSLGGCYELDFNYLAEVKQLIKVVNPPIVSDHICVSKINGIYTHELLPLPYTEDSLTNIVQRIKIVQDYLGRQIAVENVSSYITYPESTMSEDEFIINICNQADCLLLLDINNVYVSATNHGFSAEQYLANMPLERIAQLHIAGHSHNGEILVDTHDQDVCSEVWELYRYFCQLKPKIPLLLERDENLPEFGELVRELNIAREIHG